MRSLQRDLAYRPIAIPVWTIVQSNVRAGIQPDVFHVTAGIVAAVRA